MFRLNSTVILPRVTPPYVSAGETDLAVQLASGAKKTFQMTNVVAPQEATIYREQYAAETARRLLRGESSSLFLLGPGGVGKTYTSIHYDGFLESLYNHVTNHLSPGLRVALSMYELFDDVVVDHFAPADDFEVQLNRMRIASAWAENRTEGYLLMEFARSLSKNYSDAELTGGVRPIPNSSTLCGRICIYDSRGELVSSFAVIDMLVAHQEAFLPILIDAAASDLPVEAFLQTRGVSEDPVAIFTFPLMIGTHITLLGLLGKEKQSRSFNELLLTSMHAARDKCTTNPESSPSTSYYQRPFSDVIDSDLYLLLHQRVIASHPQLEACEKHGGDTSFEDLPPDMGAQYETRSISRTVRTSEPNFAGRYHSFSSPSDAANSPALRDSEPRSIDTEVVIPPVPPEPHPIAPPSPPTNSSPPKSRQPTQTQTQPPRQKGTAQTTKSNTSLPPPPVPEKSQLTDEAPPESSRNPVIIPCTIPDNSSIVVDADLSILQSGALELDEMTPAEQKAEEFFSSLGTKTDIREEVARSTSTPGTRPEAAKQLQTLRIRLNNATTALEKATKYRDELTHQLEEMELLDQEELVRSELYMIAVQQRVGEMRRVIAESTGGDGDGLSIANIQRLLQSHEEDVDKLEANLFSEIHTQAEAAIAVAGRVLQEAQAKPLIQNLRKAVENRLATEKKLRKVLAAGRELKMKMVLFRVLERKYHTLREQREQRRAEIQQLYARYREIQQENAATRAQLECIQKQVHDAVALLGDLKLDASSLRLAYKNIEATALTYFPNYSRPELDPRLLASVNSSLDAEEELETNEMLAKASQYCSGDKLDQLVSQTSAGKLRHIFGLVNGVISAISNKDQAEGLSTDEENLRLHVRSLKDFLHQTLEARGVPVDDPDPASLARVPADVSETLRTQTADPLLGGQKEASTLQLVQEVEDTTEERLKRMMEAI
ncbi:hypothetical protein GMRT_12467 [Giardia muris]|uniref:Kinesin motor domain-containing protein n=1 Tax=Giardia muris TaxID=5742 RepID=A0A4Z1T0N3_GIAMU|nr:hypothetical protein GMRT_12467 [Giardia muris]|eukprot:TNJ27463.1 hypothetical protein GMRT_12467 [Giardia muris]